MSRALIAIAVLVSLTACKKDTPATPPPPATPVAKQDTISAVPPQGGAVDAGSGAAMDAGEAGADAGGAGVDAGSAAAPSAAGNYMAKVEKGEPLFAVFHTSMGKFTVRLFSKDAPKTVANFVGLATGEKEWRDPKTGQKVQGKPLYSGTIFHRVIPDFMIQGGDPLGTGTGDPGYRFEDEFQSGRTFDKPGLLAMANAGPGTNGSQFFVTVKATPWLNNRHTIFGEVVENYEVVDRIVKVPTRPGDRPVAPVVIERIEIKDKA